MKYFLGFLASVGLIVLVFILVLRGFSGNDKPAAKEPLVGYANSSMQVKMTIDGRLNADENHRGYRIIISRNTSTIEVYKGYQNTVTDVRTTANNDEAFASFLRAIDLVGYTLGDDDPAKADERGVCPEGRRYIFEIEGDGPTQRFWSSSCGGGTFKGKTSAIISLFQRQVPQYPAATRNLGL